MRIFVFGHKGMLGRYVYTYLSKFFEVIGIDRNTIDASTISENELHNKLIELGVSSNDVVINCIGAIKPRVDSLGDLNAIQVNSVFPRILANCCENLNSNLIHPTTDCVFSGKKGNYTENDNFDVYDVYGMTKSLGEPKNCTIIRTSIIGEEVNQGRSLVEWVKSQKNQSVFGYTNHLWNGMTCLQFSKICRQIIDENLFWRGVCHIYSNTVNKKELVELISEIYELNIIVNPKETDVNCDRTLSSVKDYSKIFDVPNLKEQIIEMKNYTSLFTK